TGSPHGAGVFVADRVVGVPGHSLQLHVDSASGRPGVIPNLSTALVLGLSLLLFGVALVLAHDMRRRSRAERALGESLAFRKAMEDSVLAGLRVRDLQGRVTFANQAFCDMVGYAPSQLLGRGEQRYWPEAATAAGERPASQGREAEFVSSAGRRFPVMIHESPLLDAHGRQTGWICTALDLSAQRRIEDVSRLQQERLQATARLATVGEMASLLSHELNQPLSAIASFATGSINLLDDPRQAPEPSLLRQALERIAEQSERAGHIIRSVQGFVRRREHERTAIDAAQLLDAILPLARMQARRGSARVDVHIAQPVPRVLCDRTMVEQVLINLVRNGLQAMEQVAHEAEALLRVEVRAPDAGRVEFAVIDRGPGVGEEVRSQIFTPFFTTREEGMGLGLSLCRTVVEQHGGALEFDNLIDAAGRVVGACFRFTLPVAPAAGGAHD
ncbi:MAG: PAS domain S-box protein, partial [Betaproteobacteria bacterium]|nr:PAS domain S-box protein [Betaproteobacteria bacterium]